MLAGSLKAAKLCAQRDSLEFDGTLDAVITEESIVKNRDVAQETATEKTTPQTNQEAPLKPFLQDLTWSNFYSV